MAIKEQHTIDEETKMAKKNAILTVITTIASFLRNEDRPNSLELNVTDLRTFSPSEEPVSYTRKALRAFVKAVLVERQTTRTITTKSGESWTMTGLASLKGINIKALKDVQLGELFAQRTAKPNGTQLSKFYTTIRRMVKGELDLVIEDDTPAKPKAPAPKKPKASKTKVTKVPKKAKKTNTPAKPKASEPVETIVSHNGTSVTIPTVDFKQNRAHWASRAEALGLSAKTGSKKSLIVKVVTVESLSFW